MKKLTIGIIAHVDSGKTTLSESLLYKTGSIRSFGRVDKGDSFLDNDALERKRGITIFSKQARLRYGDTEFVLIDTPGHADFSAETERTLQILDYAILLISAPEGVKGQTKLLWNLLENYRVPVFVFFNKIDQLQKNSGDAAKENEEKQKLLQELNRLADGSALDFSMKKAAEDENQHKGTVPLCQFEQMDAAFLEQAAMCSEEAMEEYLSEGKISEQTVRSMIQKRQLFPCFFGSALKSEGVEELLAAFNEYALEREYPAEFSARVYKIARDEEGTRLTFVKILGGQLKVKTDLPDGNGVSRIHQIRYYSGDKYEITDTAEAGDICALTGLKSSAVGQTFGKPQEGREPVLTPVLSYRLIPGEGFDPLKALPLIRILEEESPELSVRFDETRSEIYVNVMGTVQLEILTSLLKERFDMDVAFDSGEVLYRETLAEPVIGVGHFEPLRHYAEVHLMLEPLPAGSGLVFDSVVSTDRLAKNWQRLILTHLAEKRHVGVLTRSPVTDLKITLIAGKAHLKHTEGGDFRQATYRAVRQGLMMGESVLLEPYYRFSLELPSNSVGRALTDLDQMNAEFGAPELLDDSGISVINGRAPVAAIKDYPVKLASYTRNSGTIHFMPDGYGPCHNAAEVIMNKAYDPLNDRANTPDSVFCANGSGYIVPYDEVYDHMHLPFDGEAEAAVESTVDPKAAGRTVSDIPLGTEEVDAIIAAISRTNRSKEKKMLLKRRKQAAAKRIEEASALPGSKKAADSLFAFEDAEILLVDGYNVIFAWEELNELAKISIDAARNALIDHLSKYSAMAGAEVIAVFDAYKVAGKMRESSELQNVRLVFTKEDETADQYIERFTSQEGKKRKIAVVTSDNAEQTVTFGAGSRILSSRAFKERYEKMSADWNKAYNVK